MKKHVLTLTALSVVCLVNGQEIVSTQGDSYSNTSGSIDFTIGEVVIETITDGTTDLTQGFHQTNWNFLSVEDLAPSYEVTVFPNPIADVLNIQTSTFENVTYTLYDALGNVVLKDKLSGEQTALEVSHLALGSYSLELIFEDGNKGTLQNTDPTGVNLPRRKTIKLIKIQ